MAHDIADRKIEVNVAGGAMVFLLLVILAAATGPQPAPEALPSCVRNTGPDRVAVAIRYPGDYELFLYPGDTYCFSSATQTIYVMNENTDIGRCKQGFGLSSSAQLVKCMTVAGHKSHCGVERHVFGADMTMCISGLTQ